MIASDMKHQLLLLAALLCLSFVSPAGAQTTSYYDRNGSLKGWSRTSNKVTRHYDRNGRFTGSSRRSGNVTYFYGRNGEYKGSKRTSNNR